MPKITSVEPQKSSKGRSAYGRKNPRRFNIFVDGQFVFGADEDLIVDYRLLVGKVIDQAQIEKLLFEAEVGKLMERMYGLFNIRQRSEKEVRDYLRNLSFKRKVKDQEEISAQATELLIGKLKQKRLINDMEFAQSWFDSRSKKKGVQAIKSELYKKGIDKEIIEEVISSNIETSQEQLAQKLLIKRLPRFKNLPILEKKKKSYEFLLRRGFEYELVKEVVEKITHKEYTNA